MNLQPGMVLGRWRIREVLGFGTPVLATAEDIDSPERLVTLKVHERSGAIEQQVKAEAVALRNFDHPAFPDLVETGHTDEWMYTALEPFSAESLADRMVEGPVDWRVACSWMAALASAMQHLHAQGWVHRSLSPECVYVGRDNRIWVLGLHSAVEEAEEPQRPFLARSNLSYVAPEVLVDPAYHAPRADLYAFGLIAYELLARESAFPAAAWAERAQPERMLLEWKTRVNELDPGPDQPDWVRSLVRKCTHPYSEKRLPDFDSVVAWLEGARSSWTVTPTVVTPIAVPRDQLPAIKLEPTYFDQEELALAIARHTTTLHAESYKVRHDRYVVTAAILGCAAGLCVALLSVLFMEIRLLA